MINEKVMQIKISSSGNVTGGVVLPSSKSISNRALVISALAGGLDSISNLSDCDDTNVMVKWLADKPRIVDIGAAGTAMRFSTALLAVGKGEHIITGSERMRNRPIAVLVDALRALGAKIEYVEKEGFPPLKIEGCGRLTEDCVSLPGNVSSQYISALLMIGPMLHNGLTLSLTGKVVSRPYIDMTMAIMRQYGACVSWVGEDTNSGNTEAAVSSSLDPINDDEETNSGNAGTAMSSPLGLINDGEESNSEMTPERIKVLPGGYKHCEYFVESDWSAASYWYEMVALAKNENARVELPALFRNSLQGDSRGAEVFDMLGVETVFADEAVVLRKKAKTVNRLEWDFVNMPDLAQTFVVTCCMLGVPFHFTGLESLRIKETDRIAALEKELLKLGFKLEDRNDSELLWDGNRIELSESECESVAIDTYEDHRMAMAFAPVAIKYGSIRINEPGVVTKSYPGYWQDLLSVGYNIDTIKD